MLFIQGKDMGLDSKAGTHWGFGRDVAGFSLSYFKDDYIPIGNLKFIANIGASGGFGNSSPSLYNGNIRRATYALENLTDETLGYSYQYDQLNRLTGMDVWTNFNSGSYSWPNGGSASTKWKERVSYDANGNIQTYNRNGNSPIGMDSLTYNYYANTNQLKRVDDIVGSSNYSVDMDDQSGTNYKYDEIGNLARDASEEIDTILWTLSGKVDSISRTSASTKDELKFLYDPMGNRVAKIVTKDNNEVITTWYARDPQGNILAVYTQSHDTLWFDEAHIYGSSRLGYWKPNKILYDPVTGCKCDSESLDSIQGIHITTNKFRGDNCYEITNHLGNVLAVISDKKIAIDDDSDGLIDYFTADILNSQDYYPFGMLTPGRSWSAGSEYRFGYNTQMKVDEIAGAGNHYTAPFWEYDPRVVMRWNRDPVTYPWQSPYAINNNNPIIFSDPLGLFGSRKEAREYRKEHNTGGRIRIDNEGYYAIDNKKAGTSIYKDAESGKVWTAALITAERSDKKTVTPVQLGVEWLTGGVKSRDFTSGDYTVELYKQHQHYKNALSDVTGKLQNSSNSSLPDYGYPYDLSGVEGVGKYVKDYSTLASGGQTGNLMFTYLGSHSLWIEVTANDVERRIATVVFTVHNTSTLESGTRPPVIGYQEWYQNSVGNFLNTKVAGRTGATSETEQVFQWTETIKY